jgi:hypothetical protein
MNSVRESVKRRLERVKLKNFHCRSRYQGTLGEDIASWKRLSGCYDDLWRLVVAL